MQQLDSQRLRRVCSHVLHRLCLGDASVELSADELGLKLKQPADLRQLLAQLGDIQCAIAYGDAEGVATVQAGSEEARLSVAKACLQAFRSNLPRQRKALCRADAALAAAAGRLSEQKHKLATACLAQLRAAGIQAHVPYCWALDRESACTKHSIVDLILTDGLETYLFINLAALDASKRARPLVQETHRFWGEQRPALALGATFCGSTGALAFLPQHRGSGTLVKALAASAALPEEYGQLVVEVDAVNAASSRPSSSSSSSGGGTAASDARAAGGGAAGQTGSGTAAAAIAQQPAASRAASNAAPPLPPHLAAAAPTGLQPQAPAPYQYALPQGAYAQFAAAALGGPGGAAAGCLPQEVDVQEALLHMPGALAYMAAAAAAAAAGLGGSDASAGRGAAALQEEAAGIAATVAAMAAAGRQPEPPPPSAPIATAPQTSGDQHSPAMLPSTRWKAAVGGITKALQRHLQLCRVLQECAARRIDRQQRLQQGLTAMQHCLEQCSSSREGGSAGRQEAEALPPPPPPPPVLGDACRAAQALLHRLGRLYEGLGGRQLHAEQAGAAGALAGTVTAEAAPPDHAPINASLRLLFQAFLEATESAPESLPRVTGKQRPAQGRVTSSARRGQI